MFYDYYNLCWKCQTKVTHCQLTASVEIYKDLAVVICAEQDLCACLQHVSYYLVLFFWCKSVKWSIGCCQFKWCFHAMDRSSGGGMERRRKKCRRRWKAGSTAAELPLGMLLLSQCFEVFSCTAIQLTGAAWIVTRALLVPTFQVVLLNLSLGVFCRIFLFL